MDNDHLNGKTLDELFQLRFRKGLQIKITVGIAAKSGPHKLRIHITGLAQPMYVIATNIGKIPLMPDYYIQGKTENEYTLKNHKGQTIKWPNIPE